MEHDTLPHRLLAGALIGALALFSVAATWAAIDDYARRDILPIGASVDGVPVGGLSQASAASVIEKQFEGPLLAPVTVSSPGSRTTLAPARFVKIDVVAMLRHAAAPKVEATLLQRVWQRVEGLAVGRNVPRVVSVDTARLKKWAVAEQRRVAVPAVDASFIVTASTLSFGPSRRGSTIDVKATVVALSRALTDGTKSVGLTERTVKPKVTEATLGKSILVSRSKTTLTLYNGTTVEKTYRCAVGQPQFPTPLGRWKIVAKATMPSWINNGSAWAKGMPASIAPGPNNPLGTRALYLNAPAILIHGIPPSENWSIGSPASHGCMRMHRADAEDLYPRVPVGTRVFIVP